MTHVHFFISYTVTLTWAVRMCAYIVSLFSIVLCIMVKMFVVVDYGLCKRLLCVDGTCIDVKWLG